jgi:hypothetical protein
VYRLVDERGTNEEGMRLPRSDVFNRVATKDDFSGKGHLAGNLRILNLAI